MAQTTSLLQQALDAIELLSVEEQQTVVELVQNRLSEKRRTEIARNAEETLSAVRERRASQGTVEDLKRDLLAEE